MKKFFIFSAVILSFIVNLNFCSAKDVWGHDYSDGGKKLYIVYESVVYGYRTNFYTYLNVKRVNSSGELIRTEKCSIGHDEGDYWLSINGEKNGRRMYDYEDSSAVLNWLKDHKNEAHKTGDPSFKMVLGD